RRTLTFSPAVMRKHPRGRQWCYKNAQIFMTACASLPRAMRLPDDQRRHKTPWRGCGSSILLCEVPIFETYRDPTGVSRILRNTKRRCALPGYRNDCVKVLASSLDLACLLMARRRHAAFRRLSPLCGRKQPTFGGGPKAEFGRVEVWRGG